MKQGWTISTIGSVAKVFNGNSINAEEKKAKYEGLEEGYPFIATKDVGVNGEVDYDNGVKIPFDTDFKIAMPDAVFVCAEGGSAGKKVAHIDRKVCFGNKLFALQPIKEKVKGGFLYYAVQEAGFKAQFRLSMAGIIGGVSAKKFNSITIPIPPLSEQQRIVALLDAEFAKIDALKANAEKNLQNAKDLFQAALNELVIENGKLKGGKRKSVKLKTICSKIGSGATPLGGKSTYGKEGVSLIRSLNVHNNEFHYEDLAHINEEQARQLSNVEIKEDDVLFNITGASVTRCCKVPKDVLPARVNQHVSILRLLPNTLLPNFLVYTMISPHHNSALMKMAENGATRQAITKKQLEEWEIEYPEAIAEQQSIVARLDAMNEKCKALQANYEKTLTLCDDFKQALLRKAFNGEI